MSVIDRLSSYLVKRAAHARSEGYKKRLKLPLSVTLGSVRISGSNVEIGENTYFNDGYISSSVNGKVKIGKWCAIGYNVSVVAVSHDVNFPTGPEGKRPVEEKNIIIGKGVWIGNNVTILPGVEIGDFSVVGANSVVTKDIPPFAVCGGVPCRVLFEKNKQECAEHISFVNSH